MIKKRFVFISILTLLLGQLTYGQNNTNSPYTRFGYGEISNNYNGAQRAMGGTGIASRVSTHISPLNPASYSGVDSLTFMFDVGLSALYSTFQQGERKDESFNANLEYINLSFPLWKNMGFSAGVLPYSFTGYSFSNSRTILLPNDIGHPDTVKVGRTYYGQGGVSQVYGGISMKFLNHFSVGVNAYYMWGSITNNRLASFTAVDYYGTIYSSYEQNKIQVNKFKFRYGLQVFNTFNKKHTVTLGAYFEPKTTMKNDTNSYIYSGSVLGDTIAKIKGFDFPMNFGVGVNYVYDNKLTVALDYTFQRWSDAQFFGIKDTLNNSYKLSAGVEYYPNSLAKSYFKHMRYRVGFSMSNPYYNKIINSNQKSYSLTAGVALPLRNNKTVLNVAFEYGNIGSTGLIDEKYYKLTFNANFNENWFFKRKL